ncbi:hypothetical protein EF879_25970 [Micromonospora sp. HM5-17]|nr:hypothetical protein EF879_25970 [Micromonospora sp. HM5-17]
MYLTLLLVAVVALAILLPIGWFLTVASIGDDDLPLVVVGAAVATVAAILLLAALVTGRAAIHGDVVATGTARTSAGFALAGGLTGWIGAGLVVLLAIVLALLQIDVVLVKAVPLTIASLLSGVLSDRARRIATTALSA